jgi:hypothetical protein
MVNRDRVSLSDSSANVGRWVMSTSCFSLCRDARYMTSAAMSVRLASIAERFPKVYFE